MTGEVLDMTCYIASNLSGPDHAIAREVASETGSLLESKLEMEKFIC